MKRNIPTSGLVVMPNCGHLINLEEPDAFNRHLADFFHAVDLGKWPKRDPRALVATILGAMSRYATAGCRMLAVLRFVPPRPRV